MTDMRRTLLWVVFVMSLVLLWDGWNRHTGAPTMFGGAPARAPAAASAPTPPTSTPSATTGTGAVAAASSGELITLTTDTVKATIDSRGGELVRLELLQHRNQVDTRDLLHWFGGHGAQPNDGHVVLFDRSAQRLYFARTGLATVDGIAYPNHETVLRALPGPRELGTADTLQLTLESPVINGVQLRKTYTFKRGDYRIGVRHEVLSSTDKPLAPQLYLQLVRDGNPPAGESSYYFTFTGPVVYTDAKKFQKVEFKDIEKNKLDYVHSADDGWIAMVQHYFASAWLIANGPREFMASKLGDNLYAVAMM